MMMIRPETALSTYKVLIHEAEEGGFWAEVLGLPGCVSQGETEEELLFHIREAIEAVLECQDDVEPSLFQLKPEILDRNIQTYSNIPVDTWTSVQP